MHSEHLAEKQWEGNWGWLARGGTGRDQLDQFVQTHGADCTYIKLNKRQQPGYDSAGSSPRSERGSGDSVDEFVRQFMLKTGGSAMRNLPRQEFKRPLLTSHSVGWGNNLERFGSLQLAMR